MVNVLCTQWEGASIVSVYCMGCVHVCAMRTHVSEQPRYHSRNPL